MRSWEGAQDLLREWESRGPRALMTVEHAIEKFLEDAHARKLADATIGKQKVLRPPRFHQTPTLPFTEEEWAAILAAVERYPSRNSYGIDTRARLRACLLVLRYSGLRIRDVVCLLRNRIKDGKLMLYTQKTGQPVFVPLPRVVTEALDTCGGGQLPFWTGSGNPKSAVADWQRSLRRLFKLAGVENGHAHRFRDTFAVRLLEKGIPLESVAVLLGNSLRIAERHYAPWVKSRQVMLEDIVRRAWTELDTVGEANSPTPNGTAGPP